MPKNLVENGDFSTDPAVEWSLPSATWNEGPENVSMMFGAGSPSIYQDINAKNGHLYLLVYTLSGFTSGFVTPYIGGTAGVSRGAANATYYEKIIAALHHLHLQY